VSRRDVRPTIPTDEHSIRVLLCELCGAVLDAHDADDLMLRRLSQFARFGIGAESGPLLSSGAEE
jgi:hypothetical protein